MDYPTNKVIARFNHRLLDSESTHAGPVAAQPHVAVSRTRQASSAQATARFAMGHIAMPMPVGQSRSSLALTDRGDPGESPLGSIAARDHAQARKYHTRRRAEPA